MQRLIGLVRRCTQDYNMISPGDKIGVGVSGGKDSMLLAQLLIPGYADNATRTVYVDINGSGWSTVNIYAWNDYGDCTGQWPGSSMLKKSGKPVVLCVNKCDTPGELPPDFYEFYNLGLGDPIAVSSVHGHGTGDLLVVVDIAIPSSLNSEEKELVAKLAQMPHFRNPEKSSKQNIFERMKDFFN